MRHRPVLSNVGMMALLLSGLPSTALSAPAAETEEERRARLARLDAEDFARREAAQQRQIAPKTVHALRATLESPCLVSADGAHTVETRANGRICTLCRTWGPLLIPPETRQQRRAAEREKKSRKR